MLLLRSSAAFAAIWTGGLPVRHFSVSTSNFLLRTTQQNILSSSHRAPGKTVMPPKIAIVGGTGFIGRRLVCRLYELGYMVKIIARKPHKIKTHLEKDHITVNEGVRPPTERKASPASADRILTTGLLGMEDLHNELLGHHSTIYLELYRASVKNSNLTSVLSDCDSVINLVGILNESRVGGSFQDIHADGAARVAAAAQQARVKRFIQVSAIGASEESASAYARSKALGEEAVLHYCPSATIIRPSIVVGPGDGFFSFFDRMAKYAPYLPLVDGGKTKFQPVHVDDLVEAICVALVNEAAHGQRYEIGGKEVFTFKELLEKLLKYRRRRRFLLPVPLSLANKVGALCEILPFTPLLTRDQVKMLQHDNVVSPQAKTIQDLGIKDLLTIDEALKDIFEY